MIAFNEVVRRFLYLSTANINPLKPGTLYSPIGPPIQLWIVPRIRLDRRYSFFRLLTWRSMK